MAHKLPFARSYPALLEPQVKGPLPGLEHDLKPSFDAAQFSSQDLNPAPWALFTESWVEDSGFRSYRYLP